MNNLNAQLQAAYRNHTPAELKQWKGERIIGELRNQGAEVSIHQFATESYEVIAQAAYRDSGVGYGVTLYDAVMAVEL